MTKKENTQRIKNEALNKIRNLYNPNIKIQYSDYRHEDGSYCEQRDNMIERILEKMKTDLKTNSERIEYNPIFSII